MISGVDLTDLAHLDMKFPPNSIRSHPQTFSFFPALRTSNREPRSRTQVVMVPFSPGFVSIVCLTLATRKKKERTT